MNELINVLYSVFMLFKLNCLGFYSLIVLLIFLLFFFALGLVLVEVLSIIFLFFRLRFEFFGNFISEVFLYFFCVASIWILRAKFVLTDMPILRCKSVHIANTEVVTHKKSLKLLLIVLWPSIIFHTKWDPD